MSETAENAPKRLPKPSGWKGSRSDVWWAKSSSYGLRYKYPYCGRETLGVVWGPASTKMHWSTCPKIRVADAEES